MGFWNLYIKLSHLWAVQSYWFIPH